MSEPESGATSAQWGDVETAGAPVVAAVSLRINAEGTLFGLDFACRDGAVRAAVLPAEALTQLLSALLVGAAEAGRRHAQASVEGAARLALRDVAPRINEVRVAAADGDPDPVVELQAGAALVSVRVPRKLALQLAQALVDALTPPEARAET